ncbi:anhydro-N-acetylmuramic acid kinase [Colwellia asteriadis]|uniref:Anhydro-N-acetylmuramic acid kinase n=1 Tax=Colwellia asteriadis TaxID=517723 RepID=A0ABP3WDK8_9GAMM
MSKVKYYIGLMSGTSADGVDLALVDFTQGCQNLIIAGSYYQAYTPDIVEKITSLYNPHNNEIDRAYSLDVELAHIFGDAIRALLLQENLTSEDIIAIGNHGQTIRHRPDFPHSFTVQIGCSQTLAVLTGIKVIGQFRRKDMALGGQGAPLVPAFHQHIFSEPSQDVFVVNIGGIANITFLPEGNDKQVLGFDTGPGNALLDDWFKENHLVMAASTDSDHKSYDENGHWASTGSVNLALLSHLLQDSYFALPAPKSTGREYFTLNWLFAQLTDFSIKQNQALKPNDVQATLVALTAHSIANEIIKLSAQGNIYLCGGGIHNRALMQQLKQALIVQGGLAYELLSTQERNIDGDVLEATAFAWLAYAYEHKLISSISAVTGARVACTLGVAFYP